MSQKQHATRKNSSTLPAHLKPLFWEYRFRELSWRSDKELIVLRILQNGNWKALSWLLKKMGKHSLQKWMLSHRVLKLDARRLRYWGIVLDLPARNVDKWVREQKSGIWHNRIAA